MDRRSPGDADREARDLLIPGVEGEDSNEGVVKEDVKPEIDRLVF